VGKRDLAIDLGTANTLVYMQGRGIVFNEPTVVAIDSRTGDVRAVGRRAWELAADNPSAMAAIRPLQRGAITDFDLTQSMVRTILKAAGAGRLQRPRVLVCVPSSLTTVERRAVEEAVTAGGARSVDLVEEPLAAAIGAGLPIHDAVGSMIVDVGGGTTELAMMALGATVTGHAIEVGGFDMDWAIQAHLKARYGIAIGEKSAERIKIQLGSAYPAADARGVDVVGREVDTGHPRTVTVSPTEIREVLAVTVYAIVAATRDCLAESPPELAHDVLETGLFLTGGAGMLRGLDMRLAQECEVPVHLTEHPLATVVLGAGRLLDYQRDDRAALLTGRRSP
jgi:rod shape-determining protein MreB